MTEKERIMELYLQYGEREFEYIPRLGWEKFLSASESCNDGYL